jgi:hypothetical protein
MEKRDNIFERNPVKTILVFLLAVLALVDLTAGTVTARRKKELGISSPLYHHDLEKSACSNEEWGGAKAYVCTDSLGFKDASVRKVDPAGADGRKRVLLLGDSFTEGVGYPYGQTFAGLLAAKLGEKDFEVLNAGVASYSPKLYYLKLKYLLEKVKLRVDRLYVFIDISDAQDEIMYEPFTPETGFSPYKALRIFLRDHSVIFPFLYGHMGVNRLVDNEKKTQFDLWGDEQARYKERSAWLYDREVDRKWGDKGVALELDYMKKLCALCRERGIPVTLGVYPWPEQILKRDVSCRQVAIWRGFARANGAGFMDYFPVFMGLGAPEAVAGKYFIKGDVHWTAEGHSVVADRLYARVKADFGVK